MVLRQRADAEIGQELVFVEHAAQETLHAVAAQQRQEVPLLLALVEPVRYQPRQLRPVLEDPVQPLRELGQLRQQTPVEHLDGAERDEPDDRAHPQRQGSPARQLQHVVVELVDLVP